MKKTILSATLIIIFAITALYLIKANQEVIDGEENDKWVNATNYIEDIDVTDIINRGLISVSTIPLIRIYAKNQKDYVQFELVDD